MNPGLLLQEQFNTYTSSNIKQFLEFNDKGDVSDSILWETFKVVARGNIIAYEASRKKEKRRRLAEIEALLPAMEQAYRLSKSQSDLNAMLKLKYEYNNILSEQVSNMLLKIKRKQFEMGDKPERLLSRQLRGMQANRAIFQIKSSSGVLLTKPKEINACFLEFYKNLFTSKCNVPDSDITDFLDSICVPKLGEVAREELDKEFTLEEILKAIKNYVHSHGMMVLSLEV